jgi:hypothetical protein
MSTDRLPYFLAGVAYPANPGQEMLTKEAKGFGQRDSLDWIGG